jgi:hypothetical protein
VSLRLEERDQDFPVGQEIVDDEDGRDAQPPCEARVRRRRRAERSDVISNPRESTWIARRFQLSAFSQI